MRQLPKARWMMVALCFSVLAISYIDRINLAIAAPHIKADLGLNDNQMGLLLGAFFWTYAFMQLPAGWILDRLGARLGLALACGWWSVWTALTAAATGFASLFGVRLLLGIGEAGSFPACGKVVRNWFPKHERGIASALSDMGTQIGTAVALPLVAWLIATWDWRVSFVVTGLLGLVWLAVWLLVYREPEKSRNVTAEQLQALRAGENEAGPKGPSIPWLSLFRYPTVWGMMLGFFSTSYVKYFFITWFPTYLMSAKGFSLAELGTLGAIPALMSVPGSLLGGWLTDTLYRRGLSLTAARKTCLVTGLLTVSVVGLAPFVESSALMLTLFSITYAALGFTAAVIWTLPADVAPTPGHVASIWGIQNFASNLAGIVGTSVTGYLLFLSKGSFIAPLVVAASVALVGALSYLFVMGRVEPLGTTAATPRTPLPPTAPGDN